MWPLWLANTTWNLSGIISKVTRPWAGQLGFDSLQGQSFSLHTASRRTRSWPSILSSGHQGQFLSLCLIKHRNNFAFTFAPSSSVVFLEKFSCRMYGYVYDLSSYQVSHTFLEWFIVITTKQKVQRFLMSVMLLSSVHLIIYYIIKFYDQTLLSFLWWCGLVHNIKV
jgi:hypothetical protein